MAHEALIREWGILRKWLGEDRESLRTHRHLTEAAQEWERRGRDKGELYRGVRLTQIQDWMERNRHALSLLEEDFLDACFLNLKRERSAIRLRWYLFAGSAVIILLTILLALTGQLNYYIQDFRLEWRADTM
ncbi:hypothetical protein DWB58_30230 [candidate division KSB1 bacterium]|nr:hypothetical protein [candidate division KSB1 bacterium]